MCTFSIFRFGVVGQQGGYAHKLTGMNAHDVFSTPKETDSERNHFPTIGKPSIVRRKYCSISLFAQNLYLKQCNRQGMLVLPKLHQKYNRHMRDSSTKKHPPPIDT